MVLQNQSRIVCRPSDMLAMLGNRSAVSCRQHDMIGLARGPFLPKATPSVVHARSVIVIALLAICRKVIILDPHETDALHTLASATVIFALGVVYWLIRDSDCRQEKTA